MDYQNNHRLKAAAFQFLKFNVVGISNILICYGIYSLVVFFTDSYRFGLLADYSFGIIYTYSLNKFFTFRRAGSGRWKSEFLRIIILYLVVFLLNWFLLNYLVEDRDWDKYLAQGLALAILTAVSFLGQKYLVFREWKK